MRIAADPERRVAFPGIGEFERPLEVTPALTGWEAPSARAYQYRAGQVVDGGAEGDEMVMWLIAGTIVLGASDVPEQLVTRRDPFADAPTGLFLPPGGTYRADVREDALVLYCRVPGRAAERPGGAVAVIGAEAATAGRLRLAEHVLRGAEPDSVALGGATIVYHRFARPDGFAVVSDGDGSVVVNDGDAFATERPTYDVAVAPRHELLAVTVTLVPRSSADATTTRC